MTTRKQQLMERQQKIERELAEIRQRENRHKRQADTHIKCVLAGHILETQKADVVANLLKACAPKIAKKYTAEYQALLDSVRKPTEPKP